jgi:hypothetical protein
MLKYLMWQALTMDASILVRHLLLQQWVLIIWLMFNELTTLRTSELGEGVHQDRSSFILKDKATSRIAGLSAHSARTIDRGMSISH